MLEVVVEGQGAAEEVEVLRERCSLWLTRPRVSARLPAPLGHQ